MSTTLDLQLQGYPTLRAGGRPLALGRRHALALVARLAEAGAPVGRGTLAAWLWPDAEPALGRGRLRRLVHELHASLGRATALLAGDADALWLLPGVRSDLQATRAAMREGDLAALLAPGRETLLEGFALGVDTVDAWIDDRRRAHHAAWLQALQRAAEAPLPADAALAQALGDRLVALEPCSEAGHAARIAAAAMRGDRAGVDGAYVDAAARLREELGLRPPARLEAAYTEALARLRREAGAWPIRHLPTAQGDIACSVHGDGPQTLLVLWGLVSNLEVALDQPQARAMLDRLAQRHRVVLLDRRGTGLSERVDVTPDADAAALDLRATLDHLGVERAWLFGASVGGTLALDFALRHPERTAGLLLHGTSACGAWAPDWPWALRREALEDWAAILSDPGRLDEGLRRFAPSRADDPAVQAWYARLLRNAATRRGALAGLRAYHAMDLRPRLPALRVPTLVMQRRGDRIVPPEAGRWLARAIPGARFEPLEGDDHFHWFGDAEAVTAAVERFVAAASAGVRRAA